MRLQPIHTLSMNFLKWSFLLNFYIVVQIQDTTKSFVITKMVCGMERKHKRVNARKPITFEILEKIINVLLHVCNSYYEATTLSMNIFEMEFSINFYIVVQKYQKLVWNHRR
jgi:hypothetical protein